MEADAFSFSGLLEGIFEMGGKAYHGNIEVVKMIPETGEVIFTGKSKLERCIETG